MKKFILFILCLSLMFAPLCVYAAQFPEETLIMMGDVNSDGIVTADDARIALRISAGIENINDINMLRIDTDANGEITAADARNILRKSASLSEFYAGFNGEGIANALEALKISKYTIQAETEEMSLIMVIDGENIYLETPDLSFPIKFDEETVKMCENTGFMYLDGKLHFTFTLDGESCAWIFTEGTIKLLESMGDNSLDIDEIFKIANTISDLIPEKFTAPDKITENGETLFVYKSDETKNSEFIVDANGKLRQINDYNANGKIASAMIIEDFSTEISSFYFDTSRFDSIQLF